MDLLSPLLCTLGGSIYCRRPDNAVVEVTGAATPAADVIPVYARDVLKPHLGQIMSQPLLTIIAGYFVGWLLL